MDMATWVHGIQHVCKSLDTTLFDLSSQCPAQLRMGMSHTG